MSDSPKTRILFVDDDPLIRELLQSAIDILGDDWTAKCAESGDKALAVMEKEPFDLVISDIGCQELAALNY